MNYGKEFVDSLSEEEKKELGYEVDWIELCNLFLIWLFMAGKVIANPTK